MAGREVYLTSCERVLALGGADGEGRVCVGVEEKGGGEREGGGIEPAGEVGSQDPRGGYVEGGGGGVTKRLCLETPV